MKSIMEEASSISKAIDQAWNRAGKPIEFTVKILEVPERNMFGLTVKSAKIAFFFDEHKIVSKPTAVTEKAPVVPKHEVPQRLPKEAAPTFQPQRSHWNDEMIRMAKDWIQQTLYIMGLPNITFSTTVSNNALTLRFNNSVTGNEMKDRLLFSSFAYLILTMLRHKFRKAFRHLKVILITQ